MQTPDPITLALTGQLPFILLVSAALALGISLLLLWRYRASVVRSMRRASRNDRSAATAAGPGGPGFVAPLVPLRIAQLGAGTADAPREHGATYRRALRGPWRTAAAYSVGGVAYAVVLAEAFLPSSRTGWLPLRFSLLAWSYAWPLVLTIGLVAASTARSRLLLALAYAGGYCVIGFLGMARSPDLTVLQLGQLWAALNLPPTLLLWAFLNRRIRAVGPIVLAFMVVAVAGATIVVTYVGADDARLRTAAEVGRFFDLGATEVFLGMHLLGFVLAAVVAWPLLRVIGWLYRRRKLSDQTITVDAMWLLFAVVHPIGLAFESPAWIAAGPAGFVLYKLVSVTCFRLLRERRPADSKQPALLLLRVFALGPRSERLFDALSLPWRHIGTIRMIAGPDLATSTVEPHEFLDFLGGRLSRQFIDGQEALERRLAESDSVRDPDGRYRVHDFFCHENTWRMVLQRLLAGSDRVLMDLRGFSASNQGCIYEIGQLIDAADLARVLFVVDETTDLLLLGKELERLWEQIAPDSPNRAAAAPHATLFRTGAKARVDARRLLLHLLRDHAVAANGAVRLNPVNPP